MHKDSIEVGGLVVRSTGSGLVVTTATAQYNLDGQESLELLAFLYDNRDGFYHARHGLPDWVRGFSGLPMLPEGKDES